MNYFITGIPGSGKSIILELLEEEGYPVIDVNYEPELCFWVRSSDGKMVPAPEELNDDWYKNHEWHWDSGYLSEILSEVSSLPLFVGGMTVNQGDDLEDFDKVFLLQVTGEEGDVSEDQKVFEEEMIQAGAIVIDGNLEPEEVLEEIMNKISVH